MLADALKMPAALLARLAVTEASLQRIHDSQKRDSARWSFRRRTTARRSYGETPSEPPRIEAFCFCAPEEERSDEKWCRMQQFPGSAAGRGALTAVWKDWKVCLARFGMWETQAAAVGDTEWMTSVQHSSMLIQELRADVGGLPDSCLGAAAACMAANMAACLADRRSTQQASFLERPRACRLPQIPLADHRIDMSLELDE